MGGRVATILVGCSIVVACGGPDKPASSVSSASRPASVDVGPVPAGPSAGLSADDASAEPDPMAPPASERSNRDPACTAVATRGRHLIGLLKGCVKCEGVGAGAGSTDFVEMRDGEYGRVNREEIVRKKCATHTDVGADTCTVIFDGLGEVIRARAAAAGLRINGIGIGQCAVGPGYYVTTDDAKMGEELQRITRDVMQEWTIRGTIHVRVAPMAKAYPL